MNALLSPVQPCTGQAVSMESKALSTCANSRRLLTMGKQHHRILYVDDDALLRELGEQILVHLGYDVDTAEDGAKAWQALREHDYQLLITDFQMPGITGLELIRQARRAQMHLPVILTSAVLHALPAGELAQLETKATLAKPFTAGELISAVRLATQPAADTRIPASTCRPASGGFRLGCKPHRHWGINE